MPADDASGDAVVVLDRKFARAVEAACSLHRKQVRKGTDVPYAAHLLGVASLVLEGGGNQREAIAALLHDALEDTSATPKQIRKRFGRKVARIVVECTDVPVGKNGKRKKQRRDAATWRERKLRSLEHLRDPKASVSVLRVRAGRRALQRAHHAGRPAAIRARDVGSLQRRCGRPALVLPIVVDRALGAASRSAQRRAARHRA